MMALIDTALDTVREAVGDVADIAGESLSAVGSALGDLADHERSRKGLLMLVVVLVLAALGFYAWKRSRRSTPSSQPEGVDISAVGRRSVSA